MPVYAQPLWGLYLQWPNSTLNITNLMPNTTHEIILRPPPTPASLIFNLIQTNGGKTTLECNRQQPPTMILIL